MRICQWDILDFIKNPKYQEKNWPADFCENGGMIWER
jgi:hypothetical protein